jgi:Ser/Thr protein kinase RdoA (MazF antagonist)
MAPGSRPRRQNCGRSATDAGGHKHRHPLTSSPAPPSSALLRALLLQRRYRWPPATGITPLDTPQHPWHGAITSPRSPVTQAQVCPAAGPVEIAGLFHQPESVARVSPLGSGNVNDTFLVTLEGESDQHAVLQRLNTRVFRQPRLVMGNIRTVSEHVARRLAAGLPELKGRRWEMPRVLPASGSGDPLVQSGSDFWRALSFVEGAESLDVITGTDHAREVGTGLGIFHLLIHDLPPGTLADTLEGFHLTPGYLSGYHQVLMSTAVPHCPRTAWCTAFIREREGLAPVLEEARARGELKLRPIHGDPKINNVMLDRATGRAVALVDLDTVKPGLVQWDIGDCLRSGCNPLGEETTDLEAVRFDLELCEAILSGYLSMARGFLNQADYRYIFDAIRLISFELGLRFFSDHLAGNIYFKARHRQHNLDRALVQFRLTESIEAQEEAIRALVERCRFAQA